MLSGITKWSPISGNVFGGKKVGLASNLLEMNNKISVYSVDWRAVIHLLLALIVQCRYGFFHSKVLDRYSITLLGDPMSRYGSV